MELPKNITQIGEADRHCRVYVEDYVVSYLKQMNRVAGNKDIAVALYGRRQVENGVTYLFAYGAAKLTFLQREVRHLSQAQEQEIEKLRKKYFAEMSFLGYRILNGEMIEGFHICEQELCRYVTGYAQFYEKNDSMLAYMLENREEEAAPEQVDQEKYEVVKRRQEERRAHSNAGMETARRESARRESVPEESVHREAGAGERTARERREPAKVIPMPQATAGLRRMKMAATGVFVLLCVMALALMRQESTGESFGETARQVMSSLMEQKLPDAATEEAIGEAVSTLVAEGKLEDALREENAGGKAQESQSGDTVETDTAESGKTTTEEPDAEQPSEAGEEQNVTAATAATTESEEAAEPVAAQPVNYTIRRGDTLIGICERTYGSTAKVSEICALNGIQDPDDIKIGQEILLP